MSPVRMPAAEAARTAPIIASSGCSPAKRRAVRSVVSSTPRSSPKAGSNSAVSISPVSSARSSRSASASPRKSFRTLSGSRPSPSQNCANAGQMELVRTPAEVDYESLRRHVGRAGYSRGARRHRPRGRRGVVRRQRQGRQATAGLRADLRRPIEPDLRRRRRRRPPVGPAPAAARQAARLGARHGPGAPRDRRAPGHPGAGPAGDRVLRGRVGERRTLLRDGLRRRADPALPA